MLGRSGNPSLNAQTFANSAKDANFSNYVPAQTMTLEGTVNKTGILLALVVISAFYTWSEFFSTGNPASVMPLAIGGAIVGFILALVTIFKKQWAGTTAPLYAIAEGLFLGAISAIFEAQYPGIVIQAVGLTLGTLASLLFLYKTGIVKPTENFRLMVTSATMGIAMLYPS
jgi:uncharacterized YccA/Bax inhibitor family protein